MLDSSSVAAGHYLHIIELSSFDHNFSSPLQCVMLCHGCFCLQAITTGGASTGFMLVTRCQRERFQSLRTTLKHWHHRSSASRPRAQGWGVGWGSALTWLSRMFPFSREALVIEERHWQSAHQMLPHRLNCLPWTELSTALLSYAAAAYRCSSTMRWSPLGTPFSCRDLQRSNRTQGYGARTRIAQDIW
jgi:hypothetical protein